LCDQAVWPLPVRHDARRFIADGIGLQPDVKREGASYQALKTYDERIRTGSLALLLESLWMSTVGMNLFDLTPEQLKRAASIKEQIDRLNRQLRGILGAPATPRAAPTRNRTMSAAVKKKIAATQRARWAQVRSSRPATVSARPAAKTKRMTPAARARLSAKLKAYWAAKKKSGK
jgi:hypothetical protein